MVAKTINELIEIAENLDWSVSDLKECGFVVQEGIIELEFGQYSPAGEDFHFAVSGCDVEEIANAISEYSANFDTEEHIEMWIQAKQNGVGGVPNAKELVEDAEEIQNMLRELSSAITYGNISNDEFNGLGKTRGIAFAILKIFEALLDKYDIKIREDNRTISDDEHYIDETELDDLIDQICKLLCDYIDE